MILNLNFQLWTLIEWHIFLEWHWVYRLYYFANISSVSMRGNVILREIVSHLLFLLLKWSKISLICKMRNGFLEIVILLDWFLPGKRNQFDLIKLLLVVLTKIEMGILLNYVILVNEWAVFVISDICCIIWGRQFGFLHWTTSCLTEVFRFLFGEWHFESWTSEGILVGIWKSYSWRLPILHSLR